MSKGKKNYGGNSDLGMSRHRKSGQAPRSQKQKMIQAKEANEALEEQRKKREARKEPMGSVEDLFGK